MPNITAPALSFPTKSFPGAQAGVPAGVLGELVFSEILPKYATLAKAQKMYYSTVTYSTAPASFVTAAQFGPMIWNSSGSNLDAYLLAVGISNLTTANTGGGAFGWSSNQQNDEPTTATLSPAPNCYAGGGPSGMAGVFSTATIGILPTPKFWPLISLTQAAITLNALSTNWIDVGGALVVGPGNVGYLCGSAVLTATVTTATIVWAELST